MRNHRYFQIYWLPSDFNFSEYDHARPLLGMTRVPYVVSGYDSHHIAISMCLNDHSDFKIMLNKTRNGTREQREAKRAYRIGFDSIDNRDADCPYDQQHTADAWAQGRDDAEVEMGEAYADFCDPSSRDCYE